ncbi:hypothetical protein [Flavobacterium gelatinilyticum]|uniref:hypothetical protein n=1 Tax=Flavobacterium gelatinilyticum TaxID=3003260 RepID=UPI0024810582|nr:hypothetical protein [Flavobacterium gelatinilyticum]
MAILKQAKNIFIETASNSTIIVKNKITKTANKIVLRTTENDIVIVSSKQIKTKSNGD